MNLIKNIIFVTGKINAVLIIITQMVLAQVSIALSHFIYIVLYIYELSTCYALSKSFVHNKRRV